MNKNNLIPTFLKSKCSTAALNNPPTVKNPVEAYGFEKSIYFSCLFIKEHDLLSKFAIDSMLKYFSSELYKRNIKSDREVMKRYNALKAKNAKPKTKTVSAKTIKSTVKKKSPSIKPKIKKKK